MHSPRGDNSLSSILARRLATRDRSPTVTSGSVENISHYSSNESVRSNVCRTSSGNSSFTAASVTRRELSRLSPLNRSFNDVSHMAADFRRKLHKIADANNQYLAPQGIVLSTTGARDNNNKMDKEAVVVVAEDFISDSLMCGREENNRSPSSMMRQLSSRIKSHVQASLSDPLREKREPIRRVISSRGVNTYAVSEAEDSRPLARSSSVKRRMASKLVNRLQLPKFFNENEASQQFATTDCLGAGTKRAINLELILITTPG